ncbi:acetylornithine deacetylase [Kordiimonas sediminis]|uniref:Acetylornithine deacetylase n=1 Tax=Kordiimonas sediminis TaxID=1735581 RepID=A0A919AXV0_9PROT|nr:M20/M25/M40 family metallo-hydrolase [Kordiimonas sediminis]GHF28349.1 acetylornithine deacetylase [Kordiimonas sediminis]
MKYFVKTIAASVMALSVPTLTADANEQSIREYTNKHQHHIMKDFRDLLSMPNVSSSVDDMMVNAAWITDYIHKRGFTSEIVTAGRAPYIIAEKKVSGADKTVLIYAHFDGQPVEPANWATAPFTPTLLTATIENGGQVVPWDQVEGDFNPEWRIAARSAGDDKAPVIALMHALDAMEQAGISPSVNIKLILDGEEEAGSPTLKQILADHRDKLEADLMLFCDGPMHQSRDRQLVFGVRGSMALDITTYGPLAPLHSGHYGNWAPNPTESLMKLLLSMKSEDGKITIDGYSDQVRPISNAEREALSNVPNVDTQMKHALALAESVGKDIRLEESVLSPGFIIRGFQAGGVGKQGRNIIQPSASASINMRLVADQTPEFLVEKVEDHVRAQGYTIVHEEPNADIRRNHAKLVKLDWRAGAYPAFRSRLDSPEAVKLISILDNMEGNKTILAPSLGGSLPIYLFEQALENMPIIILPVANHDNNQHGRNENLRIQNLWDAISVYAAILEQYGTD